MDLPERHMLLGIVLGAVSGIALAAVAPGAMVDAFAEEVATPAFNTAQIVKFEGHDYQIENEDWVSTDATATARIKKVEAGRVSYVTVTTTPTGTYSTDAMFSRHVQYPGVTVTDVSENPENAFKFWTNGKWYAFRAKVGNSFSYYGTNWQ